MLVPVYVVEPWLNATMVWPYVAERRLNAIMIWLLVYDVQPRLNATIAWLYDVQPRLNASMVWKVYWKVSSHWPLNYTWVWRITQNYHQYKCMTMIINITLLTWKVSQIWHKTGTSFLHLLAPSAALLLDYINDSWGLIGHIHFKFSSVMKIKYSSFVCSFVRL